MSGKKFSVKAVFLGFCVQSIVLYVVSFIWFKVYGALASLRGMSHEEVIYQFQNSLSFLVEGLILGLFFAALGGYVAARIAKQFKMQHAFVLGILTTIMAFFIKSSAPAWYVFAALILHIPFTLLGGYIATRRKE